MARETLGVLNLGPEAGEPRAHRPGARLFVMIVIGTLPLLLVLPIKDRVEALYSNSIFIGVALVLTGCMLYVGDRMLPGKKTVGGMTILDALIIGLCQCAAVIPDHGRDFHGAAAGFCGEVLFPAVCSGGARREHHQSVRRAARRRGSERFPGLSDRYGDRHDFGHSRN